MRTLIYSLFLLVIFGSSFSFAASTIANFGGLFSQVSGVQMAFKTANSAFTGAGCAIIICSVVGGIKNAGNAQQMVFAIVNPLILCVLMGISMDGNPWGTIGLCTLAGNLGDDLAAKINPAIYNGVQFDGTKLFQPGGPIKNLGDIWNKLTGNADDTKEQLMNDPGGAGVANDTPAAKEDIQYEKNLSGTGGTLSGGGILGALLGLAYLILFGIIEVISIILIAISAVIVNIMLTLRLFLLLLSSVFLPLFIAALSLGSVRSIGQNYIMSVVCLASWPMGWAAGHIGTIALFGMAWDNLNNMILHPFSLSLVLSTGLILLICPFWIIVVTLSGPSAMCKMVTKGANFASSMATSSMQMAASTAGTALIAGAAIATGGSSLAVTGIPGGIKGPGGDCDCSGGDKAATKSEGEGGGSAAKAGLALAAGAGGGGGGVDFKGAGEGATSSSVSSAAGEVGADQASFDFGTSESDQAKQLDFGFEKMEDEPESDDESSDDDGQMSFDFGNESDTDTDAESSFALEKAEEHTAGADTGEAEVAEGAAAALATTAAVATSGDPNVVKTPEELKAEAAAKAAKAARRKKLAGRIKGFGNLLIKASKFDGSPESLVRSGLFDIPEPKPQNKELDMLQEIRDELKGMKSSGDAMKDIGVDPSKKALGPPEEDAATDGASPEEASADGDSESDASDSDSPKSEAGTGNPGGPVVMGKTSGADGSSATRGSTSDMVTNPAAVDSDDGAEDKKPSKVRKLVKGTLKNFGGLLKKASTFDGSPESLVRSGFFDIPEPQKASKEYDVLTDIRDSLKESNASSLFAMKQIQVDPSAKAAPAPEEEEAPTVTTPAGESNDPGDDEQKERLAPTLLKGFGNLLKKASTFDGSGSSLVKSKIFDIPEPEKEDPQLKVLKEIKSQIRNMNPSVRKALDDIKSKDTPKS